MKTRAHLLVLLLSSLALAAPYKADPGPNEVTTSLEDWKDDVRDRTVPVKIYMPRESTDPMPIVLLSHGLGGTRNGMEYIARHWASYGYFVVHMQHIGSDDSVWRGKPNPMEALQSAITLQAYLDRVGDVKFVIDHLTDLNSSDAKLKGKLDLERIAMAGHSFGAQTTQAVSGQMSARGRTLVEPRIKCSIAFSPAPPQDHSKLDVAFGSIKIPMMHMTGTKDSSPVRGDAKPEDRRLPYDNIFLADQYLVIFTNGDHMTFSGARLPAMEKKYEVFHGLIQQGTTAFLDAYLRGDEPAKKWLQDGEYEQTIGESGTVEHKDGKN